MTEQARLYGTVLYELKLSRTVVEEAKQILDDNPELVRVLTSPAVSQEKKDAVIGKIWTEPECPSLMVHFLKKACDAGCIGQMDDIVEIYHACALDAAGILPAQMEYVTAPDEAQIAGIKQFLCRKHGKKEVQLHMAAVPELMGGFVLKAGDMEYDYSLRGKLNQLKQVVTG